MFTCLGLQNFRATLTGPLMPEDDSFELSTGKNSRLCAALSNGAHTYLAISCPGAYEIVKATSSANVIVLERGQEGTAPQHFPIGACVDFIMGCSAVNDLIAQYMECPQECIQATIISGSTAPNGQVAVPYEHRIGISGTPPFRLGMIVGPRWLVPTIDAGQLILAGTPDRAGTFNVQVPIYSCGELIPFWSGCIEITPEV